MILSRAPDALIASWNFVEMYAAALLGVFFLPCHVLGEALMPLYFVSVSTLAMLILAVNHQAPFYAT